MRRLLLLIVLFLFSVYLVSAQSCSGDGGTGSCIDVDTTSCPGVLVHDLCPGPDNIVCCLTNFGGCTVNGVSGTCIPTSLCSGTSTPGYCPGPDNIQCCTSTTPSAWTIQDCENVASAWYKAQVKYSWSATTPQYVTYGPGPYRTDCSGFVSAAWNVPPPGAVTYDNFPCYQIDASELRTCDALLNPAEHVALFIGWDNGQPLVMEECGHVPECCGSEATCPGACGPSESDCNEYCPGCPIMLHTWSGIPEGFYPCRRNGW